MRKSSSTLAGSGKRSGGILSSAVRKSVTRRISRLLAGDTLAARGGLITFLAIFLDSDRDIPTEARTPRASAGREEQGDCRQVLAGDLAVVHVKVDAFAILGLAPVMYCVFHHLRPARCRCLRRSW